MLLILYEIISIPMIISFTIDISPEFEYVVTFSFILDILVTFNTAVYINGNICYSYKNIALEYLKLWFWIDVSSSFPYDMLLNGVLTGSAEDEVSTSETNLKNSTKILRVLKFFRFVKVIRLLRLAKLKAIIDKIEEYFADSSAI
jgi:hyperpolarization activated cyclic nucleotide-gated potassium channel 2